MSQFLLALAWGGASILAIVVAIAALAAAAYAILRLQPRARVRPFHRFRLVNKSDKDLKLAEVVGVHPDSSTGSIDLSPDISKPYQKPGGTSGDLVADDRLCLFLGEPGPDGRKLVQVRVRADGDSTMRQLMVPTAQTGGDPELESVEVVILRVLPQGGGVFKYECEVTVAEYRGDRVAKTRAYVGMFA